MRNYKKNDSAFYWGALVTSVVPLLLLTLYYFVFIVIPFKQNVTGKLKQVADANTIALAEKKLGEVVNYLEENKLVEGKSHIVYFTPDCDVTFWYDNLKQSYLELQKFPEDADSLTTSNQLMKLRETILDEGERLQVTTPSNIRIFPNQKTWALGFGIVFVVGLLGAIVFFLNNNNAIEGIVLLCIFSILSIMLLGLAGCSGDENNVANPKIPQEQKQEAQNNLDELEGDFIAYPPTAFERVSWEIIEMKEREKTLEEAKPLFD
jgi:hypothetical protein